MKKLNLLLIALIAGTFTYSVFAQYTSSRSNTMVTESWVISQIKGNIPRWFGSANSFQRGLAFYDGQLYMADYGKAKVIVIDVHNGDSINELSLPVGVKSAVFQTSSVLDIDGAGNLYGCNLQTNAQTLGNEFQIYRWEYNSELKIFENPTIILDYSFANNPDLSSVGPVRVGDAFTVYGDLMNGSGYVLTPLGPTTNTTTRNKIVKWNFQNGTLQNTEIITLQYQGSTITSNGNPHIKMYNAEKFFLDTQFGFPEMYNLNGEAVSYFLDTNRSGVPGTANSPSHTGGNGILSFKVFDREFLLLGGNNTNTDKTIPANTFQLFELKTPSLGLSSAELLYNIPVEGLGTKNNELFRLIPQVDLSQANEGNIGLYGLVPNNGYFSFKFNVIDTSTNTLSIKESNIKVLENPIKDGVIHLKGNEISKTEIYTLSGLKIRNIENQNQINVGNLKGIYLLKIYDKSGNATIEKIIIE